MDDLLHTYSIVARDKKTGALGVAVQSHWFNVGSICPWAEAGVGVIATQSLVKVSYGPEGLKLLKSGKNANEALEIMLSKDQEKEVRQVAIVDAAGNVAVHTGKRCIAEAGHIKGENFSVQANMMKFDTVWAAMADTFQKTDGELDERLMASLKAAEKTGGDIRGTQSACMLIVEGEKTQEPWDHVIMNIRVDDHPEPLVELERLMKVQHAYEFMNRGDEMLAKKDLQSAMEFYAKGAELAPQIDELPFWQAATLAENGKLEEALPIFKKVFAANRDWYDLLERLPASGLFPDDKELIKKIKSQLPT